MRMVFCTCPKDSADEIADTVLSERLVACVNIIPWIKSKYWWEGKISTEEECLLIMKTRSDLIPELTEKIKEIHPYQVPEILTFRIMEGNPDYLEWIAKETK